MYPFFDDYNEALLQAVVSGQSVVPVPDGYYVVPWDRAPEPESYGFDVCDDLDFLAI